MIRGVHAMLYSTDPDATRAFLRDVLELPYTDVGEGWLIFDVSEGEIGSHPLMDEAAGPTMDFSLYVDDIHASVATLEERGVEFKGDVEDHGWGLVINMQVPAGPVLMLYQPRYKKN